MLNTTNLKKTEEWAKEDKTWSLPMIYSAVAYVAMDLWPRDEVPVNFNIVMNEFIDRISKLDVIRSVISVKLIDSSLNYLVDEIIFKEFREWGLTSLERENGVDPDNKSPNPWFNKSDKNFVDLIAFKQNIYCLLRIMLIEDYFFEEG